MATIYSWKDMWLSTQWFCCYHFRNAIHVTHKNQESRLINFIVKRTGNSRAAPQFSEIYMKNDSFFSAGYIYYCDSPRTWKCSCQLVMLLWAAAAKDAAAEQKVDYKIIFGGLQTHSHFQVKSLQKQRALNLQPSVWVWTHKAVKISALSFNFFIHHVPVHCPSHAC